MLIRRSLSDRISTNVMGYSFPIDEDARTAVDSSVTSLLAKVKFTRCKRSYGLNRPNDVSCSVS